MCAGGGGRKRFIDPSVVGANQPNHKLHTTDGMLAMNKVVAMGELVAMGEVVAINEVVMRLR